MDEKKMARAEVKYVRISPRKVGIICDMIRGKDANVAMANAENNFEMDPEKLYVAVAYATGGPILKRGMPRDHGRMYRINKRTSHITICVAERD